MMATTKSGQQSKDNASVEKTSMFRRMVQKLKKGSTEDDLEVETKINPTERVSTEPSLREAKECTGALPEDLQNLQKAGKTSMFRRMVIKLKKESAEDDLDDASKPSQRDRSETSLKEVIEYSDALLDELQDLQSLFRTKQHYTSIFVRRLQEQTEDNHKLENEILSDFAGRLEVTNIMIRKLEENTQHRERTEADAKIRELEKRLVDQAAKTRQRVSLKDEEIEQLKSRVEVLESEKKGFGEARLHVGTQTQQGNDVLIDPRPIQQDIQKMRKENEQKAARQQELIRNMREQMEASKGLIKTLKQDLTGQIGAHEHGEVKKDMTGTSAKREHAALEMPTLLLNGLPLALPDDEQHKPTDKKDAVAFEMPTLLLNGLPLALPDDEQHKPTDKKEPIAFEVPTLLLNGLPLALPDDEQHKPTDKKEAVAFEMPTLLLNGLPLALPDDEQHTPTDKKEAVAFEIPTLLLNGLPLALPDDEQHKPTDKKEAVAFEMPTLLLNGLPLALPDDEQHKPTDKKDAVAFEVPTLLLNGLPLPDDEQHKPTDKKDAVAFEMPTLLLNGLPLPDDEQHVQTEKEPATAPMPETEKPDGYPPTNGANEGETFGKEPATPQGFLNRSLPSGDANITEPLGNPEQELPCLPESLAEQSVTQSLVEHRVHPQSSMVHSCPLVELDEAIPDSVLQQYLLSKRIAAYAQQTRFMYAKDCGLKNVPPENPYPARKSASTPAQACSGDYALNHSETSAGVVPELLPNDLTVEDDLQHKQAEKKETSAGVMPELLSSDLQLEDDRQHVQTEKEPATTAMQETDKPVKHNEDIPQCIPDGYPPINGANEGETFGKEPATPQGFLNHSLPSGDANITEPSGNPELELPCPPESLAEQSVTRSLEEYRVHPQSSMVDFFPIGALDEAIPYSLVQQYLLSRRLAAYAHQARLMVLPDSVMKQYLLSQRIAAYAQQVRLMRAMDRGQTNAPPDNPDSARKSASSPAQACSGDSKLNHSELSQRPTVRLRASSDSLSTS
ncbi:microtubule-associated protein futsch-like isoform X2 [Branchiostoma lanceolatum]|uniref:microtubule-associated protein futsch-like isoform X2 n=1 Tax=Branchiostoma lanceolatum TaxID=7740 RepID=UPI0034543D7D